MAVTADFTNFYVDNVAGGATNGGSSAGAAKATIADCTSAGDGLTITDNAQSGQWAGCAVGDFICFDTAGSKTMGSQITNITNAVATVTPAVPASQANKICKVGGAWDKISIATVVVKTTTIVGGLPPKIWVKGGTSYTAETGGTGFVDCITNAGTAALPISVEGYTTSPGDGNDASVVIDCTGAAPNYHGVYITKSYWHWRFIRVLTDTNNKYGWYGNTSYNGLLEDISVSATGGTGAYGISLAASGSLIRGRVTTSGYGIVIGWGSGSVSDCLIEAANIGMVRNQESHGSLTGIRFSNITSHALSITQPYGVTTVSGCTFYNVGGDAISCVQDTGYEPLVVTNCIFEKITGEAIDCGANMLPSVSYCAFYDCGNHNTYFDANTLGQNTITGAGNHNVFVTYTEPGHSLMVSPNTGDFSLNNTAGFGRLCMGTGHPAYRDIGAVQSMVAVTNVVEGVPTGNTVGTRVDCPVGKAINTGTPYYGNPDDLFDGEYVPCDQEHALYTGTPYYGVPGSLVDGTYYPPNAGDGVSDVEMVVYGGYFGVDNAEEGTASEELYEEGKAAQLAIDVQAVQAQLDNMTTAVTNLLDPANDGTLSLNDVLVAGGGNYVVPVAAEIWNQASGGHAYGASGGYGTFDKTLWTPISGVVAEGDVRKGVARYSGGGNGTLVGCVDTNGVNQGATGVLEAGSIYSALSLWIEKTDVVSEAFVVVGNDNYVGGVAGEYPTTLTTQTADKDAIEAAVLDTDGTDSVILLPNAINATAGTALVYAAGQEDQLATDAGAVFAQLANMTTAVVALLDAGNNGTLIVPDEDHVLYTGTPYWGVTGNEVDGNYYPPNAGDGVSDVEMVVYGGYFGVDNLEEGTANENLYEEGQAAQLLADKSEVTTHAGSIKDNDTILTINGTYDFTAAIAGGFSAGESAQLDADVLLVAAKAAFIIQGTDFTGGLGVVGNLAVIDVSDAGTGAAAGGELHLDDYVLITSLPATKYVYNAIDRGDGTTGILRASNISDAYGSGDNLTAAILATGSTVDGIVGEHTGGGEKVLITITDTTITRR